MHIYARTYEINEMCVRVCVYFNAQRTDDIFIFKIYIVSFIFFSLFTYTCELPISLERLFPSWSNLNSIKSDYNIYHHSTLEEAQVVCAHKGKLFVSIGFGADVYLYKGAHANDIHLYRYKQDKHLYWSGNRNAHSRPLLIGLSRCAQQIVASFALIIKYG